jgi:hypothetical protein
MEKGASLSPRVEAASLIATAKSGSWPQLPVRVILAAVCAGAQRIADDSDAVGPLAPCQ